jgi:hypothetical protein
MFSSDPKESSYLHYFLSNDNNNNNLMSGNQYNPKFRHKTEMIRRNH